jgi:hypothetical protein
MTRAAQSRKTTSEPQFRRENYASSIIMEAILPGYLTRLQHGGNASLKKKNSLPEWIHLDVVGRLITPFDGN